MANWVPDGGVGQMFMTIAKHAPPPPGVDPPLLWGTEERLRELFGDGVSELRVERRRSRQPFRSADHCLDFFRTYFGPTKVAFERVGPEGEEALDADLRGFLEQSNTAGDRALVLEPEYLQVIATRRLSCAERQERWALKDARSSAPMKRIARGRRGRRRRRPGRARRRRRSSRRAPGRG